MRLAIVISIFVSIIYSCCKKNKNQDEVLQHEIKGMVFNNCTDSGLANVTVYLKDGQDLNLSTVSDASGNFSFGGVAIHSNGKYSYTIYIPSKSGINGAGGSEVGFNGASLSFNFNEADLFFKPRVTPKYLNFQIFCNKTPVTNGSDSLLFYCTNNVFHNNVPDYPYRWGGGGYGLGQGQFNLALYQNSAGNYPMGKYNINIEKWINGVYTTSKDSIYLNWGANKSYTINW